MDKIPQLKIGDLTAKIPIIQGGMSVGISLSGLASAVANEGGIGVIGAACIGMLEEDFSSNFKEANKRALKKELKKARNLTNGIIGVNIMVALTDYDELVEVAVEEKADIIFLGAGLPLKSTKNLNFGDFKTLHTKVVPIVSSARAANLIFKSWEKHYNHVPDAVVVEGPLAGGHLGFKPEQINNSQYSLENLVVEVCNVIKEFENKFNKEIPVIAAGGIYSGKDIKRFLDLGAKGVQMATRFVATYECDADIRFKQAYVNCKKEDIVIIKSPVGMPGRAIKNKFLEDVEKGIKKPFRCPWKCLKTCNFKTTPYCIASALTNAKKGNLENGFAFAGAKAYKVDKIVHVKDLILELINELKGNL